MEPLMAMVEVIRDALIQAVPEVGGRVYLKDSTSTDCHDKTLIIISLGGGSVEPRDNGHAARTETVNILALAKGETEEAYRRVLGMRSKIQRIMREIQFIPDPVKPENDCLIDEIRPSQESELGIQGNGDTFYTIRTLSYEASYVTEEASPGQAGQGVPGFNLLASLQRINATWRGRRGEQEIEAEDEIEFEHEEETAP